MIRRFRDESGVVGGYEALPFGFLVFVAGTLLLVNAWAVVDGKVAASAAAREAARTFAESPGPVGLAMADAEAAAVDAIEGHGRSRDRMTVEWVEPVRFARCARATVTVRYRVPTVSVPWIGAFGDGVIETSASHSEVVDPYRSGLPGPVTC